MPRTFPWMTLKIAPLALGVLLPANWLHAEAPDYSAVAVLLEEHCADCHADATDAEGGLLMRTHEELMKGGESGAAVIAGNSQGSLLVEYLEGRVNKPGKKKIMPPGKRAKLSPQEIATVRAWIDAGAEAPVIALKPKEIKAPKIVPVSTPRLAVAALAATGDGKFFAVARGTTVEVRSAATRGVTQTLAGHAGPVTAALFSRDGGHLFTASGQAGLQGEVRQWEVASGKVLRTFNAHTDAIHALALSPDGKILATGSYDQRIKLWNVETDVEERTLKGHNGAVFGLAFRPDGRLLASASADRTIKLWDVASGERRETLNQPLKEQNAVAWTADGSRLFAAGADSRWRTWDISAEGRETTNPLREAVFAHEGAILAIALSPDGRQLATAGSDGSVKLWGVADGKLLRELEKQPDWPQSLAFIIGNGIVVGRSDGNLGVFNAETGAVLKPPAPVARRIEPWALQSGSLLSARITGEHLIDLTELKTSDSRLTAKLASQANPSEVSLEISAASDLPRGTYQLWLANAGGETAKLAVHVDDVVVIWAKDREVELPATPATVWGVFAQTAIERAIIFTANAGERFVFDLRTKEIGSKAEATFALFDETGRLLASNPQSHAFAAAGRYRAQLAEKTLGASPDHFFALTLGRYAFVTGVSPLVVRQGKDAVVSLLGINTDAARVTVGASKAGEVPVPIDAAKFRSSKPLSVLVTAEPVIAEGDYVLDQPGVKPELPFPAKAGQRLAIETVAASRGSPIDTRIEVLWPDGKPVENVRLQATKQTQQAFRGINSVQDSDFRVDQWEEMELRQFLYCNGEVVRLFRAPQGPDSGFTVFAHGTSRRTYFNTSASAHALEETYYIVHPLPPGSAPLPNGLPVFIINYENDDDPERELGRDSRLLFHVPKDGDYRVRLSDNRGFTGPDFAVHLRVREAQPRFVVSVAGAGAAVIPGTATAFDVVADRLDGFPGEIRIDFENVPPGFSITSPLVIEDDHLVANGALAASADAAVPPGDKPITLKACAKIDGREICVVGPFGVPQLKKDAKPQFKLSLDPPDITIKPGAIVAARLKVERLGNNGLLNAEVLNLPHGVIVNNIGLNGVQIAEGATEREIEFACERWVPDSDRQAFAVLKGGKGLQAGAPIAFHVRGADAAKQAVK
ncbi:MAG: c-type cytochrome domain-containing protein [Verrucomicrobiales bacterium]